MSSISSIIDNINTTNGKTFSKTGIDKLQQFIDKFAISNPSIAYCDHGSNCICFRLGESGILKIYQKGISNRILRSSDIFNDYMNHLRKIGLPIVATDMIYEDEYHIAAIQPYLIPLQQSKLNAFVVKEILKIVETMLKNRTRIPDVYYRNFGIDIATNRIMLFDFHESINFYDTIDLFTSNLLQMFSLLYDNKLAFGVVNPSIRQIISAKFGEHHANFLEALYNYKIDDAIRILRNEIYPTLSAKIERKFSNYQHYQIDRDGCIHLQSHTKQKAEIAMTMRKRLQKEELHQVKTILDAGCSYGAIGIYLRQPAAIVGTKITLNNLDERELAACRETAESVGIFDIEYKNKSVLDLPINEKYDLTLFFALVHHLLKTTSLDNILRFIKLITNKMAIIEFPMRGDSLLENVIQSATQDQKGNYDCLESIDGLREIISKYGEVIEVVEMKYEMAGIRRYTFILAFN